MTELIDGSAAADKETGFVQQVCRGVAADCQLREDRKTCSRAGGPLTGIDDLLQVAGEVPDGGVDLG